ncbi:unnamed protein product, partial [Staurois parvus]
MERQVSGPGGATGLGPSGGAGGRRTPRRSDRSRALQAERRAPDPQEEATGLGPSGGAAGTDPRWSDRSRALRRRQRRRRTPPRATGLGPSSGVAGAGTPRRSDGHRVTRHESGLRVNWYDRRHWVRHCMVWLDSGHRVTRHQVIWLDSGH